VERLEYERDLLVARTKSLLGLEEETDLLVARVKRAETAEEAVRCFASNNFL